MATAPASARSSSVSWRRSSSGAQAMALSMTLLANCSRGSTTAASGPTTPAHLVPAERDDLAADAGDDRAAGGDGPVPGEVRRQVVAVLVLDLCATRKKEQGARPTLNAAHQVLGVLDELVDERLDLAHVLEDA